MHTFSQYITADNLLSCLPIVSIKEDRGALLSGADQKNAFTQLPHSLEVMTEEGNRVTKVWCLTHVHWSVWQTSYKARATALAKVCMSGRSCLTSYERQGSS